MYIPSETRPTLYQLPVWRTEFAAYVFIALADDFSESVETVFKSKETSFSKAPVDAFFLIGINETIPYFSFFEIDTVDEIRISFWIFEGFFKIAISAVLKGSKTGLIRVVLKA